MRGSEGVDGTGGSGVLNSGSEGGIDVEGEAEEDADEDEVQAGDVKNRKILYGGKKLKTEQAPNFRAKPVGNRNLSKKSKPLSTELTGFRES